MKAKSIKAKEAMKQFCISVHVIGLKELRFRIWLGSIFLKIGAWILNCKIEIK